MLTAELGFSRGVLKLIYRKSGNFHCKNIFAVDGGYEN